MKKLLFYVGGYFVAAYAVNYVTGKDLLPGDILTYVLPLRRGVT